MKYFGPMAIDAAMSCPSTLQYLSEHALGANAQHIRDDEKGDTLLHVIMRNPFWGDEYLRNCTLCLVEHGNVNLLATNNDWWRAEQVTEEEGHAEIVKLLKELQQKTGT